MGRIILKEQQLQSLLLKLKEDKVKTNVNEGIWDSIKYGLSKLGRYKADGKIFGKGKVDQAYKEKMELIINKKGNELIKKLDDLIKQTNQEFPNNKDPQKFLETIITIASIYDSIIIASSKGENEEGYLPIDAANGLINDLREYVKKYLDVDLAAVYTGLDEEIVREETTIHEEDLSSDEVRDTLKNKRKGGNDFDSKRIDTLKSNKLPIMLTAIGSALGGLSWLTNTEWFKSLFEEIIQNPTIEHIKKIVSEKSEIFASIKPNEGMTQIINRLNNLNLNPNSSPEEFLSSVKQLGGGDLNAGINALTQEGGIFKDPTSAKKVLEAIAENPNAYGNNLGEVFSGKWAGTGREVGDMLTTETGGNLKALVVNTIIKSVPKVVMKSSIKVGAGYGIAKGLGSILGPLGIGLITAGALVKLFRLKGQKSSRAATLNLLYQSIRNIEGGLNVIEPEGDVIDVASAQDINKLTNKNLDNTSSDNTNSNDLLYNNLKKLFQFIVNNKNVLGTNAKSSTIKPAKGSREDFFSDLKIKRGTSVSWRTKKGDIAKGIVVGPSSSPNETMVKSNKTGKTFSVSTKSLKTTLSEGKYFKDKRLISYLEKTTSFDKIKKFEDLLNRIEIVRNGIKKMNGKVNDKVLSNFLKELEKNPIMLTDFNQLLNVNANNPQEVNIISGMIKEILSTLYSGEYKFMNIIDKMGSLGGGNINKISENEYSYIKPNKNFLKDAQSRTTFKKNLLSFLKVLMSIFQYLHKQKSNVEKNDININESVNTRLNNIRKVLRLNENNKNN